jgi:hypothetical protein
MLLEAVKQQVGGLNPGISSNWKENGNMLPTSTRRQGAKVN